MIDLITRLFMALLVLFLVGLYSRPEGAGEPYDCPGANESSASKSQS